MHHSDWQPIETSPGYTTILVLCDGEVFQAHWDELGWEFPFALYHGCGCCGGDPTMDQPTHWMPLPAPPTEG